MKIAGDMLKSGIITDAEMRAVKDAALEKYRPVIGMLLSGKSPAQPGDPSHAGGTDDAEREMTDAKTPLPK